jgi:ATP-dependent DNA helicase RecG
LNLLSLPKLSQKRLQALQSAGIRTTDDLLYFFPYRYLDRSKVASAANLSGQGEEVTVVGKVLSIQEAGFGKKKRLEVLIGDEFNEVKGIWFRGTSYFKRLFKEGETVAFFGAVKRYGRHLSMAHPEVDKITPNKELSDFSKVVPIYPSNQAFSEARITSKLIHSWIQQILEESESIEFIPDEVLLELDLPKLRQALEDIHLPTNKSDYKKALERFKFEELFLFELGLEKLHNRIQKRKSGFIFEVDGNLQKRFIQEVLPFELTEGQHKALKDIRLDLKSGSQMNRLLQGDVGAGKTVVAVAAMLMALDSGFQSAFIAPTEILAEQHYRTLNKYLKPLGVNVRLLVGGQKSRLRTDILTDIEGGSCQVVVGTHAVIQESVRFHKLGMAIIDEQHRFGVKQRAALLDKGEHPHMLVMSATPIPRSLAMTVYGDLDVSVIKGLPAGRKEIKTAVRGEHKREDVLRFVKDEVERGGQIYVVYPLVEESEALDLKDATAGFEKLKAIFPEFSIDLVHGKMKSEEKDRIMQAFTAGEVDILVSTTVIEVGVDVPNASVMIIEHAERFGLSQLHQLRGRIGRGSRQSYCILMRGSQVSEQGRIRLKTMAETTDGFKIAETDLKLRGPGDFLGTRQSGLPDFKFADIVEDQLLLIQAKELAKRTIQEDPDLQLPKNAALNKVFGLYFKEKEQYYGLG